MAIPKRNEQHLVMCALCGEKAQFGNLRDRDTWVRAHSQRRHLKTSSYIPDALRSITVLYETEKKSADVEQPPEHIDPTSTVMELIVLAQTDGLL